MDLKPFYSFLMFIAGVATLYVIFVFMPMFFTYLSEGDTRAPSQIVPQLHNK